MKLARLAFLLTAPLLLASCLLTPGRFTSSLDVRQDRTFRFTYAGEVVLVDPAASMSGAMAQAVAEGEDEDKDEDGGEAAAPAPAAPAQETQEKIAERRAMAEALSKEVGYRSVEYLGNNKFRVDYAMTGKLDRGFVFPINTDVDAVIPWIALEVRRDGTARVKAMAFGQQESSGLGAANPASEAMQGREGTFALTTDAELVMHNNEEGLAEGPGARVVWRVTPTSKTVPTAVLRFKP